MDAFNGDWDEAGSVWVEWTRTILGTAPVSPCQWQLREVSTTYLDLRGLNRCTKHPKTYCGSHPRPRLEMVIVLGSAQSLVLECVRNH